VEARRRAAAIGHWPIRRPPLADRISDLTTRRRRDSRWSAELPRSHARRSTTGSRPRTNGQRCRSMRPPASWRSWHAAGISR